MTLLVVQVGVDGAAYGRAPDEIAGLELYARQTDEAVRRAYLGFLRYCADTGGLPPPARELLDADGAPPAPPIDAPADSSAPPPAAGGGRAGDGRPQKEESQTPASHEVPSYPRPQRSTHRSMVFLRRSFRRRRTQIARPSTTAFFAHAKIHDPRAEVEEEGRRARP